MKAKITILLWCLLGVCSTLRAQFIQVDDTYDAQQLIQNVLVNSPCATVFNFQVSGDPLSPGQQSYGYFNSNSSGFPFADGVLLSTARAKRSEGPNNNLIDEGSTAWLGDADLEQALGISNTFNATVLEFDFTPLTSLVSFDYLFASEEYYGSSTCNYSDGFAFLLKVAASALPYQNLALIPNTNTPVLVTTVHPEITGSCPAQNEQYFGSFNGSNAPINYNGQTVAMTAKASVIPGTTYHIKLVIADDANVRYDSGIFLSGGSFKVGTDLGDDLLIATNNPVCSGQTHVLSVNEPSATAYKWFKDNVEQLGQTAASYTVSAPGTYRVEVSIGSSGCISIGEIKVEYAALPVLSNAVLVQCDENNDNLAFFNLHAADDIVKNGQTDLSVVTYFESYAAAQNFQPAITTPDNYESGAATVFARVENAYGCYAIAQVQLQLSNNAVANFPLLEVCDHDADPVQDGFYYFTLADADAQVLENLPSGLSVQYYASTTDALLHPENALPPVYYNTEQNNQTVYAKILNGPNCYDIIAVNLVVNTLAPPNFEEEHLTLCGQPFLTLAVNDFYTTYLWNNGDTTNSITVDTPGIYTITVGENDCSATKTFVVTTPADPIITEVDVHDMTALDNTVLIHYTGEGNYEFSIDGIHFQDSPFFENVEAGDYKVVMREISGCGIATAEITVLNFPRYFTPNGDGYHDYWNLPMLEQQSNARVSIFDRYGKLIAQFDGKTKGWDGKLNAKDLPSTDYWFILTLDNGKTVKGHFSLKR